MLTRKYVKPETWVNRKSINNSMYGIKLADKNAYFTGYYLDKNYTKPEFANFDYAALFDVERAQAVLQDMIACGIENIEIQSFAEGIVCEEDYSALDKMLNHTSLFRSIVNIIANRRYIKAAMDRIQTRNENYQLLTKAIVTSGKTDINNPEKVIPFNIAC